MKRPSATSAGRGVFGRIFLSFVLALFVFLPTLDGLACASESEFAPHGAVYAANAEPDGDAPADRHVPAHMCSHGHCHHGQAAATEAQQVAENLPLIASGAPVSHGTDPPVDPISARLERPPRA